MQDGTLKRLSGIPIACRDDPHAMTDSTSWLIPVKVSSSECSKVA